MKKTIEFDIPEKDDEDWFEQHNQGPRMLNALGEMRNLLQVSYECSSFKGVELSESECTLLGKVIDEFWNTIKDNDITVEV